MVENVDWDCVVHHNYADCNLGLRHRVVSGLSWVFEQVEEAIILEDDCLPDPTFFRYCDELLERYRDDPRVAMISGDNLQHGVSHGPDSYFFSKFTCNWGWATWRRAWEFYDPHLVAWGKLRKTPWLREHLRDTMAFEYWRIAFDSIYRLGEMFNNWDYQWTFACWLQNGLSVAPNRNLVSNIGFDADSNSGLVDTPLGNIPTEAMDFPLRHPSKIVPDLDADEYLQRFAYGPPPPTGRRQRVKNSLYDVMPLTFWRFLYRRRHHLKV